MREPPEPMDYASMGPPPFGDGDLGNEQSLFWNNIASMGPPPFGDGDTFTVDGVIKSVDGIQWGHRLSAMEI